MEILRSVGPKYGYFPKASKSHLIVKQQHFANAIDIFSDTEVQLTTEGQRHLGAVIGSAECKKQYVDSLIDDWNQQLKILPKIAEIEPQAAYSAFIGGFKGKLTYFMRTIPEIDQFLKPIENTIRNKFIPALTGGHICYDNERQLLSLPARYGGLGIPIFFQCAQYEYNNSRKLTSSLSQLIIDQNTTYTVYEQQSKKIKSTIKQKREDRCKNLLQELRNNMPEKQNKLNDVSQELKRLGAKKHANNMSMWCEI